MSEPKAIVWFQTSQGSLRGRVGGILLFEIHYNSTGNWDSRPYILRNNLPGYNTHIPVDSLEKGRDRAYAILIEFMRRISR